MKRPALGALAALLSVPALAQDIPCVDTTWRMFGKNDAVCIVAFDDPGVPGVACHVSQAKTGGIGGSLGWATDPARFSVACRQVGPITADVTKLPPKQEVFNQKTSILFNQMHVWRLVDRSRNTLVYLVTSDKLIDGSPQNSISTVPVMPWGTR